MTFYKLVLFMNLPFSRLHFQHQSLGSQLRHSDCPSPPNQYSVGAHISEAHNVLLEDPYLVWGPCLVQSLHSDSCSLGSLLAYLGRCCHLRNSKRGGCGNQKQLVNNLTRELKIENTCLLQKKSRCFIKIKSLLLDQTKSQNQNFKMNSPSLVLSQNGTIAVFIFKSSLKLRIPCNKPGESVM